MKISKLKLIGVFLVFCLIFLYAQNNLIQINEITIFNEYVEGSPLTILQLSDLHHKSFGDDQQHLIDKIAEINPNMIVFTGDLIDASKYDPERSLALVKGLSSLYEMYYVTGNHEAWSGEFETLEKSLISYGVHVLRNDHIMTSHKMINMIGIDDSAFNHDVEMTSLVMPDKMNILLSHRPEKMSLFSSQGIDLMLSGHAHGGQIRIPFIGGLFAPDQGFLPKLTEGEHLYNDMILIISRGLGNSKVPQRIFNRPELLVITIE